MEAYISTYQPAFESLQHTQKSFWKILLFRETYSKMCGSRPSKSTFTCDTVRPIVKLATNVVECMAVDLRIAPLLVKLLDQWL